MAAAPRHRLGEIISTGLPILDGRRIRAIICYDQEAQIGGWDPTVDTEIELEPDWVELGEGQEDGDPDGLEEKERP